MQSALHKNPSSLAVVDKPQLKPYGQTIAKLRFWLTWQNRCNDSPGQQRQGGKFLSFLAALAVNGFLHCGDGKTALSASTAPPNEFMLFTE